MLSINEKSLHIKKKKIKKKTFRIIAITIFLL